MMSHVLFAKTFLTRCAKTWLDKYLSNIASMYQLRNALQFQERFANRSHVKNVSKFPNKFRDVFAEMFQGIFATPLQRKNVI